MICQLKMKFMKWTFNKNVFINVQIQGEFVSVGLDLRLILFGFLFSAFKVNDMFLFIKIKNKC